MATPAAAAVTVALPAPGVDASAGQAGVGRPMVRAAQSQVAASGQTLTAAIVPASASGGIGGIFEAFFNAILGFFSQIAAVFGFRPTPSNSPPVASAPSVGSPDPTTGLVTGWINAVDPDGDPLTYSSDGATLKGDITLTASGAFTYTPTATARQNAGATGATDADKTDSFTVTIYDSYGETATVTVDVRISPISTANTNQPPTIARFTASSPSTTGQVIGRVIASDPNGDPLTYSFPAATTKGTIVRNLLDLEGTFVYTPTVDALRAASATTATSADKSDTFIVTVSDGRGGVTTIPVTVMVGKAVDSTNSPPVAGTPAVGAPDPTTGVVIGRINATDPDGNALTFNTTASPSKGTVNVSATSGSFSFTPTAGARQNAAAPTATTADKTDSFTVTVSDGKGGSVAVPVTVSISPAAPVVHNTVIATVRVGGSPYKVAVSPDGTRAYVTNAGTGTVSVIDTASNVVKATINVGGLPVGVAISPDGATAYIADSNGTTAAVIRTSDNTVTRSIAVGEYPYGVAVSADGKSAYFANIAGTVAKIDTASQNGVRYNLGGALYDIAVSPAGNKLYVADVSNNQVLAVSTATNSVVRIAVGRNPYGMAMSPDGTRIYVANQFDGTVSVISTISNKVSTTIAVGSSPWGVAVSPDGKVVYVVNQGSNTVSVIRTSDNTVTATIPVGSNPTGVAFSPDGQRAYVTNKWDFTVSVISV